MSSRRCAQRRQPHLDHVEPVVEVRAERAARRPRPRGRGWSRRSRGRRPRSPRSPPTGLTLRSWSARRQLHLEAQRQLADLVEEQRAADRPRGTGPACRATAPVNAPFSCPNSSDSMSSSGIAPQLTATNGSCRAAALAVEGARHQLLARTCSPVTSTLVRAEWILPISSNTFCIAAALAEQQREPGAASRPDRAARGWSPRARFSMRAADHRVDLVDLERLGQVVVRALLHRGERGVGRRERGDQDDLRIDRRIGRRGRRGLLDRLQQPQAVHAARHLQVRSRPRRPAPAPAARSPRRRSRRPRPGGRRAAGRSRGTLASTARRRRPGSSPRRDYGTRRRQHATRKPPTSRAPGRSASRPSAQRSAGPSTGTSSTFATGVSTRMPRVATHSSSGGR